MSRALSMQIALFAGVFFPLHVLPPILSDAGFMPGTGDGLRQIVGLAYHLGFMAGAAAALSFGGTALVVRLEGARRWLALALIAAVAATLIHDPVVQILGRFAYGAGASLLLLLFYRDFARSRRYDRLPKVFGYAAILLETGGLVVGLIVTQRGSSVAIMVAIGVTVLALLAGGCLASAAGPIAGTTFDTDGGTGGRARTGASLSGPWVYMVTAMLAYAGFFLMLLTLGSLRGLDDGALTSGLAIFSTAFAFSAGNLVRFERWAPLASPIKLVSFGVTLSLIGSLVSWSSIHAQASTGIVVGAMLVAFGNGITVSRCFQRASIASPDGYSGPLLTMAGVMALTVSLSIVGQLLGGSAPMVQFLAFAVALTALLFGGHRADCRSHL
ncbi:hypothetical protein [Ralstonia solanacearum]|uniref:hypothetical protein n=1 Tax=Ralstonia solanacearum TaxID=305 RepID=UPI0018D1E941|nr:hypothetical protein [Ralstonia solanacearum]